LVRKIGPKNWSEKLVRKIGPYKLRSSAGEPEADSELKNKQRTSDS
jgi:hypothetical protein